ncbi:MAG: WS/DGAT domain-containing protein, partial [Luminiphilus sp.]|nr:WS/DGAT domain-containing protein [Luminiphilus sp.]
SIVTDGMAMNITLITYDQNVDFGIVACRKSVPQVQRFIDYMEEALVALEDAAGLRPPEKVRALTPRKPKSQRKTPIKAALATTAAKPKATKKTKLKAPPKAKSKANPKAKAKPKAKPKNPQ